MHAACKVVDMQGNSAHLQAVSQIRELVVRHGQLAESGAVMQGAAKMFTGIVLQHEGVEALNLLQTCVSSREDDSEGTYALLTL